MTTRPPTLMKNVQYPILFTLRSFESDKVHERTVARDIFCKMASIDGYAMLLSFGLQEFLARHPPGGGQGAL